MYNFKFQTKITVPKNPGGSATIRIVGDYFL